MNADDDGFCEHFAIMRMTDSKPDDLKVLQAKGFVNVFDDRVLVILDWKENNQIKNDRYTPSKYLEVYREELKLLSQANSDIDNKDTDKPQWLKKREKAMEESSLPYSFSYKIKAAFWGKPCICCNETMGSTRLNKPSIQHNVPLSKGGEHEIDNISVICSKCNSSLKENETDLNNTKEVIDLWIAIGNNREPQDRLGKDRRGKNNDTNTLATKSPDEVNLLLDFFKQNINPHMPFNNTTQRKAAKQLIDTYGLEKTQQAITYLEAQRKSDAYLPTVTTPYELLTKWAKIKQHLESKKIKGSMMIQL